jgi:hypothetical protein
MILCACFLIDRIGCHHSVQAVIMSTVIMIMLLGSDWGDMD